MKELRNTAVTDVVLHKGVSVKRGETYVVGRPFYSLTYRLKGSIRIRVDGKELVSLPDTVTFIPAGVGYHTEVLEDVRMIAVHFRLSETLSDAEPQVLRAREDRRIRQGFERLLRSFRVDSKWSFETMEAFYALLSELCRLQDEQEAEQIPASIRRARHIMENDFADPTLGVDQVARRLGVSTSYLRREFKRSYQTHPLAFLRGLRMDAARQMLISEDRSVNEIAQACGFGSTCYFIQSFHREMGQSPGEFRRCQREIPLS